MMIFRYLLLTLLFVACTNKPELRKEKLLERKLHSEMLKNHPYQEVLKLSKEDRKAKGLPPNKYYEQEYLLEINPSLGRTTPENLLEVQENLQQAFQNKGTKANRAPGDAIDNMWVERGPNNVGGRTRALLFDPNDTGNPNPDDDYTRVFAGGVSGGLWVNEDITDEDSSWTRVGITENLAVSCITVDPNNPMNWYAGTGESYTGNDGTGTGLWKSTDGGATWSNVSAISIDLNQSPSNRYYAINDIIAWDNLGTTELFMAVGRDYDYAHVGYLKTGWYRSVDNGTNWTKISFTTSGGSSYEVNDIEIATDNTIWVSSRQNVFGHGGGKILSSADGLTFTEKYSFTDGNRVEIACSGLNANTIYALAQIETGTWPYTTPYLSMVKTTDGFATGIAPETVALALPSDADTGIPTDDFTRGQAFYDLVIEVDPTNDAIAYAGGIDLFRTTDSGVTWNQISKWSDNNDLASLEVSWVHADQHEMVFRPNGNNEAIFGNDGGVFYTSDLASTPSSTTAIAARNKDYNVTQFYTGAIGQDAENELLLAGAQDNGSQFVDGATEGINSSEAVFGGDGAYEFIDKDGAYMIVSYVYNYYAILALPYTGAGAFISEDTGSGAFINPADLDDNLEILYANGTKSGVDSISRYTDLPTTRIRTNFTDALLTGEATAFRVSPYTIASTTLLVGTDNGKILKVANADTTPVWSNLDLSESIATGSISCIEFGASELEIYVTLHNYGVESIWYTADGGTNWVSKEGDFPDIPVKAIMRNPLNSDEVIIGTNLGVWTTSNFDDASPNWVQSQNGMSNVKVTSFDLRTEDNTVLAATYGRGLFTGTFLEGTLSIDEEMISVRENKTKIYPTVVESGSFFIETEVSVENCTIEILNSNGAQIYHLKNRIFEKGKVQEVVVNLTPGVYFVRLKGTRNFEFKTKIIVQ